MSHYIHHVPGRLRVKTPVLKRNEQRAAAVKALLREFDGIDAVDVNTVTGSILVGYDKTRTDSNTILAALKAQGYTEHDALVSQHRPTSHGTPSKLVQSVGKTVFGILVEKAVERSAVALVAGLI
jgi:copper chaperone CopZ